MNVHKSKVKGGALCGARDYKSAIVSHMWTNVNCKHCLNYSSLKKIRKRINYFKKRLEHFKNLEKEHVERISNQPCFINRRK